MPENDAYLGYPGTSILPVVGAGQSAGALSDQVEADEQAQTVKPKQVVQAPVPIESSYFARVPVSRKA